MKYIKRKTTTKPMAGLIVDTDNISDKTKNTYSARVIDEKINERLDKTLEEIEILLGGI